MLGLVFVALVLALWSSLSAAPSNGCSTASSEMVPTLLSDRLAARIDWQPDMIEDVVLSNLQRWFRRRILLDVVQLIGFVLLVVKFAAVVDVPWAIVMLPWFIVDAIAIIMLVSAVRGHLFVYRSEKVALGVYTLFLGFPLGTAAKVIFLARGSMSILPFALAGCLGFLVALVRVFLMLKQAKHSTLWMVAMLLAGPIALLLAFLLLNFSRVAWGSYEMFGCVESSIWRIVPDNNWSEVGLFWWVLLGCLLFYGHFHFWLVIFNKEYRADAYEQSRKFTVAMNASCLTTTAILIVKHYVLTWPLTSLPPWTTGLAVVLGCFLNGVLNVRALVHIHSGRAGINGTEIWNFYSTELKKVTIDTETTKKKITTKSKHSRRASTEITVITVRQSVDTTVLVDAESAEGNLVVVYWLGSESYILWKDVRFVQTIFWGLFLVNI